VPRKSDVVFGSLTMVLLDSHLYLSYLSLTIREETQASILAQTGA
jgi:hypothetical protein